MAHEHARSRDEVPASTARVSDPRRRLTERLRLEAIRIRDARVLWRLHQDPGIARWYGGRWSCAEAARQAVVFARGWRRDGVSKWLARDRDSRVLVGRGGLSRTTIAGREVLEVGWAVRERFWGHGYATEIGRAGLRVAFEDLGAREVVAYTETHNTRSRAVMERLDMAYERELLLPGGQTPFALYVRRRPE